MMHSVGEKEDGEGGGGGGEEEKKRQKRGGKGIMKARKKEDGPKQVYISRAPRGKKKSVTVVTGLSTFGECYIRIVSPSV
jgi:translation initiation factor 1 (eIF-1/SUI1)